jgi:hypothetical protein
MFSARGRVGCSLALVALGVLAAGASPSTAEAAPPPSPNALVGVSPDQWAARQGTPLGLLVKRASAGTCEGLRVSVDGKSRVVSNPSFPFTFAIAANDPLYPTRSGKIDVAVEGLSATCTGRVTTAFTFDTTPRPTRATPNAPNAPTAPTAPSGGGAAAGTLPSNTPKATGKLASMLVPDGSFAEDDPQKLRVQGSGACRLDLTIARVDAGAPGRKTWSVGPVVLDAGAHLFNGTHFDTLAEGSYSAEAVGKDGCTGTATIDFKVTPKNTVKLVKGQPKIALEKKPISGPAFLRTKDSNILFSVTLPQSVLDEPSAGCCELEYGYKNAYGAWEVYGGGPIQDPSFGGAMKTGNSVVYKSVSGFREGAEWRVRVRGFKYKTGFEWSDWLELKVDQN